MSPNPFLVTDPVQNLSYDPSRNVTNQNLKHENTTFQNLPKTVLREKFIAM